MSPICDPANAWDDDDLDPYDPSEAQLWANILGAGPPCEADDAPPTVSPREACFAFGLANLARVNGERPEPAPSLSTALLAAHPQDCLDAAFCLFSAPAPREIVRATHARRGSTPPFHDDAYYAAIARWLACPFDRRAVLLSRSTGPALQTVITEAGEIVRFESLGRRYIAVAPASEWLPGLAALVERSPAMRNRLVVVPPHAILARAAGAGPSVVQGRLEPLHCLPPAEVADKVVTGPQVTTLSSALIAAMAASTAAPVIALESTVLATTGVLLAYAGVRALALVDQHRGALSQLEPPRVPDDRLPVYSVLIPLYREDACLGHLMAALVALDYPADKLDILFLVEADDPATAAAVRRETKSMRCRIVIVPPGRPRTKPRALNVGLRQARGTFVTIYDAEDRPDPGQIRLAAETLLAAPQEVAAVQARLSIDHEAENWLTRMFAIEYACLFEHIMPMVARNKRLFLLGGTSNHFRTAPLLQAGGWDPYNVTEDADLAVRLWRRGYRIEMIDSRTEEEAPVSIGAWLKQRSRWFKGYIQTWLVHHRQPLSLVRQLGMRDTLMLNVFIVGALTAALAHVAFMVLLLLAAFGRLPLFQGQSGVVVGLQLLAIFAGYGVNFALGALALRRRSRSHLALASVLWFPLYWLLMGLAVPLALYDLVRRPHHWRKTTHGLGQRPATIATIGPARLQHV